MVPRRARRGPASPSWSDSQAGRLSRTAGRRSPPHARRGLEVARERRWDPCISHRGAEVDDFMADYFAMPDRQALAYRGRRLRSSFHRLSPTRLAATSAPRERSSSRKTAPIPARASSNAPPRTRQRFSARSNPATWLPSISSEPDGAVIGGERDHPRQPSGLHGLTDVVIDISALLGGHELPDHPLFRRAGGRGRSPPNIHVFVAHDPSLTPTSARSRATCPATSTGSRAARPLMPRLPQPSFGFLNSRPAAQHCAGRLFDFVEPHDTCPILPFPASNPQSSGRPSRRISRGT